MKRLLSVLMIFSVLFGFAVTAKAEEVQTSARAFVLYCSDNGEVLSAKSPDERLPMASTTKIMTALITLECAAQDNRIVEFTGEMTAEGSSMYLKVGEKVRLSDLAVGMMMQSGNDAANAAAIAIDGSIKAFAKRMNRRAEELGMKNTHFVTPSGLNDEAHFSTARDMAKLMAAALTNDSFRKLTAKRSETVSFISPRNKRVTYPNHNRLLSLYEGCIGGKTGYTMTAGRCLVTAAKRGGMTLIAVTLDDRDDWDDHCALYDYGFSQYTAIAPEGICRIRIDVAGGTTDETVVVPSKDKTVIVPLEKRKKVKAVIKLPPFLYAPAEKDMPVGCIAYCIDGRTIGEIPLICIEDIAYDSRKRGFFEYIADVLNL